MITLPTPLLFKPIYKDYLWGGERIPEIYERTGAPDRCAESWEIAAHKDGDSVVLRGPLAGRTLSDLTSLYGIALVGTRAPDPLRFPLLFKLIDARERLSVQVHPSNATAPLIPNAEPKTEMWYMLAPPAPLQVPQSVLTRALPSLYAGLTPGTTPDTLRAAIESKTVEQHLIPLPATPGGALFIPGGLVHAIGEGCLIYEVQQNSNTTFRLYDWDRIGGQGKPRRLHIEQSFTSIDWTLPPPSMTLPRETRTTPNATWEEVVTCEFFKVRRLTLRGKTTIPVDWTTFHALFVEGGDVTVEAGGERCPLPPGASCLIPASALRYTLTPSTPATIIITTL